MDEGFDTDTDPQNCGSCGNVCGSNQLCCGGSCVANDTANCGYCGRACGGGVQCFVGSCIDPGIVVITELMINPVAVSDSQGEYVELFNTTSYDINLNGWILRDQGADYHVINDDVWVPAGGHVVIGVNANYGTNGGVVVAYQYAGFVLGNSGDEVELWAGGELVDGVVYGGTFDTSGKSQELGLSSYDCVANDDLGNWCDAVTALPGGDLGTPGDFNDCP